MLRKTTLAIAALLALGANGVGLLHAQAPIGVGPAGDEAEVLTRGPIHEAFAAPIGADPQPGPIITTQPPADIEELPPEVRPDDPSSQWIAGYWSWDDERNDFLWVSGVWRIPPPDRQWVPGYWTAVQGGFQRISGFWAPTAVEEIVYYPQPPQSLETGPTSPQPGPDFFWVPGQWIYRDRYLWQPGYWAAMQPQYTWVPSYYGWTPGGYIYTTGYWDLPPIERGCVFAPVYFRGNVYRRPNFYYSPSVVIRLEQVLFHLFARPAYRTYYFGDYYGTNYANVGYVPWYASNNRTRWYDPIYQSQYQRYGRNNPDWSRQYRERYDYFTANVDARPRRTFAEQQRDLPGLDERSRNEFRLAGSIRDIATDQELSRRLAHIDDNQRRTAQAGAKSLENFARHRSQVETAARTDASPGPGPRAGDPRNLDPKNVDPRNNDPRIAGPRGGDQREAGRGLKLKLPEISAEARARAETGKRAPGIPTPGGAGAPTAQVPDPRNPTPGAPGADRRGSVEPGDANRGTPGRRPDRPGISTLPGQAGPSTTTPFIPPTLPGAGDTGPRPADRNVRTPNDPGRPSEPSRSNVPGRPGELGRPGSSGITRPGGANRDAPMPGAGIPGAVAPGTTTPGSTTPGTAAPGTVIPGNPAPGRGLRPGRSLTPGLGGSTQTTPSAPSPNEPGRPGPRTLPTPTSPTPGPSTGTAPTVPTPSRPMPSLGNPRRNDGAPGANNQPGRNDERGPRGNVAPTTPTPPATSAPRSSFDPGRGPNRPEQNRPAQPSTGLPPRQADRPEPKPPEAKPPENKSGQAGPRIDRGPSGDRGSAGKPPKSDSKPEGSKPGKKDDDKKEKDKKDK